MKRKKALLQKGTYLDKFFAKQQQYSRLQGTGQNCGLVSRNRPVSSGFYKGTLVSFLVLDGKKVLYLEAYN